MSEFAKFSMSLNVAHCTTRLKAAGGSPTKPSQAPRVGIAKNTPVEARSACLPSPLMSQANPKRGAATGQSAR
jgi:hypothetical protein